MKHAGSLSSNRQSVPRTTASTNSRSPSDEPQRQLRRERMVTMIDEIYDRYYREARGELNAAAVRGLGRVASGIHDVFEVLVGIEYSAPWAARSRNARTD